MCEYELRTNYTNVSGIQQNNDSKEGTGRSSSVSRRHSAIALIVKRMRMYPLLQVICIAPYFIKSFSSMSLQIFTLEIKIKNIWNMTFI